MPTRLDKRVAKLAVADFGADPRRVRELYAAIRRTARNGPEQDFVAALVRDQVLTQDQAARLREALDQTQFDPEGVAAGPGVVPKAPTDPRRQSPPGQAGSGSNDTLQTLGEYRILRKLGEGGMGTVYLAYQESANRQVAIKVLAPHLAANPSLVERFAREALHSAKMDHPNIVRGLDVGIDDVHGRHYLVMEYVDGPSAQTLLDRFGKLKVGDAMHIALDIARALEHAQSHNIVHRDIKPENILITKTGVAKLADLGLAKQMNQASHLTATRQGFGTPYYMSYEQAINAKEADGRSDIYSLGATLYHLLTGIVPFSGETQIEILELKEMGDYTPANLLNPEIPEELSRILDRMIARNPRDRYQTASELIVDIERSELADRVMSFIDADLAMQDPVVWSRAVAPPQATQPDINQVRRAAKSPKVWYLRFHNKSGKVAALKASTAQVLMLIREKRVTGKALIGDRPKGSFRRLDEYPDFHSALQRQQRNGAPEEESPLEDPLEEPGRDWTWWGLVSAAVLVVLLGLGLALFYFLG